jgi:NAD+ kinase
MRFGLVINPYIKDAIIGSHEIINFLKDKVDLIINEEIKEMINKDIDLTGVSFATLDDFNSQNLDLLVTIGGDGTILRALHKCDLKVFGINAGVVGFLTEVHIREALVSLKRILDNDYKIDKRTRLKTSLNDKTLEPATNEAVIHTADIAKMRLYQIQVDDEQAQIVRADGIIIATPTGSTSYAMSAGGPILDPKVDAFLIVPIAPFKLSARPLVVPCNSTISIKILGGSKRNCLLVIDGQMEYEITPNDIVKFTEFDKSAEFIRFELNFYKLFEEKLSTQ